MFVKLPLKLLDVIDERTVAVCAKMYEKFPLIVPAPSWRVAVLEPR